MYSEIEAKVKVESVDAVARRLEGLGAEFAAKCTQRDYYFDDPRGGFVSTDRCLRLRRQSGPDVRKINLTYKGPKQEDNYKKRTEIELEVNDIEAAEKLLEALGYQRILAFEKQRRIWNFKQCRVCLDRLPLLGDFVEIEGADDATIEQVQRQLELADLQHIGQGYAVLMERQLQKLRSNEREVYF